MSVTQSPDENPASPRRGRRDLVARGPRGIPWIPITLGLAVLFAVVGYAAWRAWVEYDNRIPETPTPPELKRHWEAARLNESATNAWTSRNFKLAEKQARASIALEPGWAVPHLTLALALETTLPSQALKEVEIAFSRWRAEDGNERTFSLVDAHCVRGRIRDHFGDFAGALADYEAVLRLDPTFAAVRGPMALDRARLGNLDDALKDAEKAVAADPREPMALAGRGLLRLMKGLVADAEADYAAAIALDPQVAVFHTQHGMAQFRLGNIAEAEKDFKDALALDPSAADAKMGMGRVCLERSQVDDALKLLDEACAHAPPSAADIWETRAEIRAKKGDRDGAISDYRKALEVAPAWWPLRTKIEEILSKAEQAPPK